MSEVQVRPLTRRGADLHRFLRLTDALYRNDPLWVAPLRLDFKKIFADQNPLFEHAEMQLWIAERDGRDVGRIAGIVDRHFNEYQRDHGRRSAFSNASITAPSARNFSRRCWIGPAARG